MNKTGWRSIPPGKVSRQIKEIALVSNNQVTSIQQISTAIREIDQLLQKGIFLKI